jgi:hypothetical protein
MTRRRLLFCRVSLYCLCAIAIFAAVVLLESARLEEEYYWNAHGYNRPMLPTLRRWFGL